MFLTPFPPSPKESGVYFLLYWSEMVPLIPAELEFRETIEVKDVTHDNHV